MIEIRQHGDGTLTAWYEDDYDPKKLSAPLTATETEMIRREHPFFGAILELR